MQELPCNNYGVKWQLATQEGICLLAAPSCSVGSEVTDFSGKVHFSSALKQVEGPDSPVYLNSTGKMGKIKPTYMLCVNNYTANFFFRLFWSFICSPTPDNIADSFQDSLTSCLHNPVISGNVVFLKHSTRCGFMCAHT